MAATVIAQPSPTACLRGQNPTKIRSLLRHLREENPSQSAMAPQNKSGQELEVDVFKKLEKWKVLSSVEKAGLPSKAEEFGMTVSSIEKLGLFSKDEELGLLSPLVKMVAVSSAALASAMLPAFIAAVEAIVVMPDDSTALVVVQTVVAGTEGLGAIGLFEGLQEAD
ncbi:hypothetical protein LINPERHAP2_LOCUS39677 [Linum perenne]